MNPAIASLVVPTSGDEVVDLAVPSQDLLRGHSASDEEAQDEAEKPSAVGRLGLVEVDQICQDLARTSNVPEVSQHPESQRDQETSTRRLDQLLHEIDHELRVRIIVRVPGIQQPPESHHRVVRRPWRPRNLLWVCNVLSVRRHY